MEHENIELWLLGAPPASAMMWDEVAARLRVTGHEVRAIELFDPVPSVPTVMALADELASRIAAAGRPIGLVAHGLAVPIALSVAAKCTLAWLVLSNGPIRHVDPVTRAVGRACGAPALAARTLLSRRPWQAWLASSVGLRRAVVNPYVMDRDMVVALTAPYLGGLQARAAVAGFFADVAAWRGPETAPTCPILLLWGDEDRLYPAHIADEAAGHLPGAEHDRIPGGKLFHPVERPWAMADQLSDWLVRTGRSIGPEARP